MTRDELEFNVRASWSMTTATRRQHYGKALLDHDAEQRPYADFGLRVYELIRGTDGWFGDEWSEQVMPLAVEAGLAELVEYDPSVHTAEDAEPGDEIWVWKEAADAD